MKKAFQIPEDTVRFLQILGKEIDHTHIRLIHNDRSNGTGAIKGICHQQILQRWVGLGASIYAVINNGGDCDMEIQSCVALFIEHDDISIEAQAFCYQGILPEPTMQIATGGKSLHQYWVFNEPVSVEQWLRLTHKAIAALHSDPQIKNPARLMRLPGFQYYSKAGEPGDYCSFHSCSQKRYSYADLDQLLASVPIRDELPSLNARKRKTDNADWMAIKPCPICGRDLDDKCRLQKDRLLIQCHVGDTFCPPQKLMGQTLKGHDGQKWKRKSAASNAYGDAICFELVQESETNKIRSLEDLIGFVRREFGSRLAWNELKKRLEMDGRPVQDLNLFYLRLADDHGIQQKASVVQDALLYVGKENGYHPVRDFLVKAEACHSDIQLPEIGTKYIGFKSQIESTMFGNHLLAAVYRAFHPGYPYDQILILRGPQGVGKTRTIRILAGAPEHYISSSVIQQDKDFLLQLSTCWHCELEEIDGHIDSRHEAQLKALISRHTDNYRAPYAAASQDQPRQCVLTGTTNQTKLLVDATGNRRFMIATIPAPVDLQMLQADLQVIWSSVMKAFRQGVLPQLTMDELTHAADIASNAFKEDPWLPIIEAAVKNSPVVFEHTILRAVLQIEARNLKGGRSSESRRVKDCLTVLGYTPHEHQVNGLDKVRNGSVGWSSRTRGVWFAPGITPSSNGQDVADLLTNAGITIPPGPGYTKDGILSMNNPPF